MISPRLLALLLFAALPATPAAAWELRLLGGADVFIANKACPGDVDLDPKKVVVFGKPLFDCSKESGLAVAELGLVARVDLRNVANRLDFRLDFRDRERWFWRDGASDPTWLSRPELHNLSMTVRALPGRLEFTVGRFPAPGGYWLITDGGAATLRLSIVSITAYGGLRSFTGSFSQATFAGLILPLVGGAVAVEHPVIRATLSYTFTNDVIELQRGAGVVQKIQQPEMFLDGQTTIHPHPTVLIAGGLSLGSRYQLTFSSDKTMNQFALPPQVEGQAIGSFMAWAIGEWRPIPRLRISYIFDFVRARVFVAAQPLDNGSKAAGASFEDHTLKASVRIWRQLRVEGRYRLRLRENTDLVHRVEGYLDGDNLIVGLGAFVNFGVDLYQRPEGAEVRNSFTATGGLSFVRSYLDLRGGLLYTGGIGGTAFSAHFQQLAGAGPTSALFPFVLEAQRVAYLRGFFTLHGVYAGADIEMSLEAKQVRAYLQVGYAR